MDTPVTLSDSFGLQENWLTNLSGTSLWVLIATSNKWAKSLHHALITNLPLVLPARGYNWSRSYLWKITHHQQRRKGGRLCKAVIVRSEKNKRITLQLLCCWKLSVLSRVIVLELRVSWYGCVCVWCKTIVFDDPVGVSKGGSSLFK